MEKLNKLFFNKISCLFCCIIFIFNSFISSTVYASAPIPFAPNDFFWDQLQYSLEQQVKIIDGKEFLLMPSDDFNARLKQLADSNYPFGATPYTQNNLGSIHITPTSYPVVYIPFFYKTSQSSDGVTVWHTGICVDFSTSKCGLVKANPTGFESANITTSFSPFDSYSITGAGFQVFLKGFENDSNAVLNSNGQVITLLNVQEFRFFGVFECPLDDPSVFTPPVSAVPPGADVYIPKGSTSFATAFYKDDDGYYDIEGNPIEDPFASTGGNTSGSHGGKLEIDGKLDVNVSDINVNVNIGKGNSYDMPDTGFFESYLDDALDESTGIRKFIGDFFKTLPGQITSLICLALVIAILLRIIGR